MSDYPFVSIDGFEMPGGQFVRRDRDGRMLFGDAEVPSASLLDLLSDGTIYTRLDALEESLLPKETYIFNPGSVVLAHGSYALSLFNSGTTKKLGIVKILCQNVLVAANGAPKLFEIRFRRFTSIHTGGSLVSPIARDPANDPSLLSSSHGITGRTLATPGGIGAAGRVAVFSNDNVAATTLNSQSNQAALANHFAIFDINKDEEPITLRQNNGLGLEISSQTGSFGAQPGLFNFQMVCTLEDP